MRILLRAGKAPLTVVGPEASLARNRSGVFGANSGNLLFSGSVYRALNTPDAEIEVDSMTTEQPGVDDAHIERINDEFDVFVIPLANAFRRGFLPWLQRLTQVIGRLRIPVVVVGVGAQFSYEGDFSGVGDDLRSAVREFVFAVLERSATIGVRGAFTREFLLDIGVPDDRIDVIGCPSLFDQDELPIRIPDRIDATSRIAMNITPTIAAWLRYSPATCGSIRS